MAAQQPAERTPLPLINGLYMCAPCVFETPYAYNANRHVASARHQQMVSLPDPQPTARVLQASGAENQNPPPSNVLSGAASVHPPGAENVPPNLFEVRPMRGLPLPTHVRPSQRRALLTIYAVAGHVSGSAVSVVRVYSRLSVQDPHTELDLGGGGGFDLSDDDGDDARLYQPFANEASVRAYVLANNLHPTVRSPRRGPTGGRGQRR